MQSLQFAGIAVALRWHCGGIAVALRWHRPSCGIDWLRDFEVIVNVDLLPPKW